MKNFICIMMMLSFFNLGFAQSEEDLIKGTLSNYIEGTTYNQIKLIEQAFTEEANLYLTKKEEPLWTVPISEYISWFKNGTPGKFNGRVGNILSIEQFNSIAIAKVEILIPKKNIKFIDMFLLKKLGKEWKIISKSADSQTSYLTGKRILFIVSNAHYYGDSDLPTGNSFGELVNAYDTFTKGGYTVDFVSPHGGSIPLAYINTTDSLHKKYLYNPDFMYALKHTQSPDQVDSKNYRAVHYIGGGSAMFEVPEHKGIQAISMRIYEEQDGIISSVCHGTAGIVHLKTKDGQYLVKGKRVNGYPDEFERKDAAYFQHFPFLIAHTIESRGGTFNYSPRNQVHVEVDGRLITGQNYLSSKEVSERVMQALEGIGGVPIKAN